MDNITVGKYVPGNSIIHKLNPLLKLIINIIFIILVFMANKLMLLGAISILALLMFILSGLRMKQLWRMMIPVIVISIFLFALNVFLITDGYAPGGTIDYDSSGTGYFWNGSSLHWWKLNLTDKVVFQTITIAIRIYIMILVTTMLTSTTKQTALTKAIETLLLPLKLIFVPVHIVAMIISIALRFIPTLMEETQRIIKAQASRGVDFKNGGLKSKAKSMITLIIPLFVSAFAKAEDLGNAMETRGYDPYEKRTRYRVYPLRIKDIFVSLILMGLIAMVVIQTYNGDFGNIMPNPVWFI